jgi:hypothetical protein
MVTVIFRGGAGEGISVAGLPAICPADARKAAASHEVLLAAVSTKAEKRACKRGGEAGKRGIFEKIFQLISVTYYDKK